MYIYIYVLYITTYIYIVIYIFVECVCELLSFSLSLKFVSYFAPSVDSSTQNEATQVELYEVDHAAAKARGWTKWFHVLYFVVVASFSCEKSSQRIKHQGINAILMISSRGTECYSLRIEPNVGYRGYPMTGNDPDEHLPFR